MSIYDVLKEKDIRLPDLPVSGGNYSLFSRYGSLAFTSGLTPKENGVLLAKGKLGGDISPEQGYELVRWATLNALSVLEHYLGSLEKIDAFVKVTVFVSSTPDFVGQAKVANGCTDLLVDLFGMENGRPVRSAVGMAALPGDAPCEVELVVSVKD